MTLRNGEIEQAQIDLVESVNRPTILPHLPEKGHIAILEAKSKQMRT